MWKDMRFLLIITMVLGLCWVNRIVEGKEKEKDEVKLSKKDPDTGEEELYNIEDGKYYKIVDKSKEIEKETLGYNIVINRNEIEIPDCSDGTHTAQGIWYYVTDVKNDINNPSGANYPRSGNRFGTQCRMIVHTSGLFTGDANEWIYITGHGVFSLSTEVVGVYGNCATWGDKGIFAYDWARVANCDSPGFRLIGWLSGMANYKAWVDDGFGTLQKRILIMNSTFYIPATGRWMNEVHLFNHNNNPSTWDRVYWYEYPDYDLLGYTWCDGKYHTWRDSRWAGVMEYSSTPSVHPLPVKDVGYVEIRRVFNGNMSLLNSSAMAAKQDSIPSGNSNRTYIGWNSFYTWRCGSSLAQD